MAHVQYVSNLIFSDAGINEGFDAPRHRIGTEMILTAITMNVKPYSLSEVTDVSGERTVSIFRIKTRGNMFLRKVGERLPDYMTSHLRRQ
jgi:hypothetical protein